MTFTRFVAIGDSLTEGKGDVHPDGRLRGFADLLAQVLCELDGRAAYANLARPSVRVHEVVARQVPEATAFEPDLITAIAGVNDAIAFAFPASSVALGMQRLFAGLRSGAPQATIVTATLPDLAHISGVARMWRRRVAALNEATRQAAAAHGVCVVDLARAEPMARDELAMDRVHPSPLGHLRFARAFAEVLDLPAPQPAYLQARPRAEQLRRMYRTAVVAPRFLVKRMARDALIASQPPKLPELQRVFSGPPDAVHL
ncbi:SGNH/GDSL hydrolase family protein [soil metagenome]